MVFGNEVKNMQAAAYNGVRAVCTLNRSFSGNRWLLDVLTFLIKGFDLCQIISNDNYIDYFIRISGFLKKYMCSPIQIKEVSGKLCSHCLPK